MPAAYELSAGDVVVFEPGDVRTVAYLEHTGVDQYALTHITWSDGRLSLCDTNRSFARLHPPDATPTESPA